MPIIAVYLDDSIFEEMKRAQRLSEIGKLAADLVNSLPTGVEMVFGPITRGGFIRKDPIRKMQGPSFKENIKALEQTIVILQKDGHLVLNQLVFRNLIDKHRHMWLDKRNRTPRTYYEPLLTEFYAPILETGRIEVGHFLYGWVEARAPKFAHDILKKQGKTCNELPEGFHKGRHAVAV